MRAIILLMGLLALVSCDRQKPEGQQGTPAAPARQQAGLDRSHAGTPMPDAGFLDPAGQEAQLVEFRGKPLLLNLWATWCAPCVKELPTLDTLMDREGSPLILALSQDMAGPEKVEQFLTDRKLGLLAYRDPDMAMSSALGARILPTTVLYGSDGREVWRYTGDLDWTGAEARALLAEAW